MLPLHALRACFCHSAQREPYLQFLNDHQYQAAVADIQRPLVVVAGAGSGKTKMMVARVAFMVRRHRVHPANVLCISFTRSAANEMGGRLRQGNLGAVTAATFHSLCLRICRDHAQLVGRTPQFSIYGAAEQRDVVLQGLQADRVTDEKVGEALERLGELRF